MVSAYKLLVTRSWDKGAAWEGREWTVPGYTNVHGVPLHLLLMMLQDGAFLYPIYAMWKDGTRHGLIFRSTDGGETWRLHGAYPRAGGEWSILEVESGLLLGHIRSGYRWGHPRSPTPDLIGGSIGDRIYALEVWSEDGGLTWTYPVEASFQGYPNHLLKLRDGRILCTFGYRRKPMGCALS